MIRSIVLILLLGVSACSSVPKPGTELLEADKSLVSVSPAMPELRKKILNMADEDESIDLVLQRAMMGQDKISGEAKPSAELEKRVLAIYQSNTVEAKRIYQENGWPDSSMIGFDGVNAFWLLVQHSTDDDFTRTVQPAVKKAFGKGEIIDAQSYAWFVDNLLVKAGKPQRYGTLIESWDNGTPILFDLENPGRVNAVRGSIGLFNLEGYLAAVKTCYLQEPGCNNPTGALDKVDNSGWIGARLDIKGSGPVTAMTLKSLTVIKVASGSAAARAGLQIGDQFIEIDGLTVEGATNPDALMAALHKPVGSEVTIVVRQPGGTRREVVLVTTKSSK